MQLIQFDPLFLSLVTFLRDLSQHLRRENTCIDFASLSIMKENQAKSNILNCNEWNDDSLVHISKKTWMWRQLRHISIKHAASKNKFPFSFIYFFLSEFRWCFVQARVLKRAINFKFNWDNHILMFHVSSYANVPVSAVWVNFIIIVELKMRTNNSLVSMRNDFLMDTH